MVKHENDILVIPEEYKAMSIAELQVEKVRLLEEIKKNRSPKKVVHKNKSGIVIKF